MTLESGSSRGVVIAIVDDEEMVRVALRRLCTAFGMRVHAYGSGQDLIDALSAESADPPDCLLLDAHMPEMSGLEVQEHLVGRRTRFPTIVYSADDEREARDQSLQAGAVAYLRKPVAAEHLVAVIERAINHANGAGGSPGHVS